MRLNTDLQPAAKTLDEMLDDLYAEMQHVIGASPETIETNGEVERFDIYKPRDKCGWYVCHYADIGIVACFGDWKDGITHKFCSFAEKRLNKEERKRLKLLQWEQMEKRRLAKQAEQNAARERACTIWDNSHSASDTHPYLTKKQVGAYGIRQQDNRLVIPMCDIDGILHSVQTINPDGEKRFLKGGRKKGLFCLIGDAITDQQGVYLCEGYATGASLYEFYRLPVLVAFDAGNLLSVAKAYRMRYRDIPLTVCADNDRKTPGNPGLTKAREVSATVLNVGLIVPEFPNHAPIELSDFNDLVNFHGMEDAA